MADVLIHLIARDDRAQAEQALARVVGTAIPLEIDDLGVLDLVMTIAAERSLSLAFRQVDAHSTRILGPELVSQMRASGGDPRPLVSLVANTSVAAPTDEDDEDENKDRVTAIAAAETAVLIAADELAEMIGCDQATALKLLETRLRADGDIT